MTRKCGDCSLCCRLVPVPPLKKKAGERCKHQRHTGCAVYADRPIACQLWSCRWLTGQDTADLSRPDCSRYVIDTMPDIVRATNPGEDPKDFHVVQVWADPSHPDSWREAKMLAFIERRALEGILTLVRFNSREAILVLAPSISGGKWREIDTRLNPELVTYRRQKYGY